MAVNIDSVKKYIPEFSITNSKSVDTDIKDRITPYTYIDWLENTRFDTKETLDYTQQYNRYLRTWSTLQQQTSTQTKNLIIQNYKDLLKDITLNYTTAEEKRFLSNIDYDSARHLESALPFYVSKIKQITLYISRQRDIVKQQKTMSSHSGSMYGVTRQLSTQILNKALDPTSFNVSEVESESEPYFNIRIVELYDYSKEYFNQKNVPVTQLVFQDDNTIIREVLQDCRPVLELASNINLVLAGDDIVLNNRVESQSLAHHEFYNYRKSTGNLNTLKQGEYITDRLGTNTYSLSGGVVSPLASPSKPWRNILNRSSVSVNDMHDTENQLSVDQVGGYFLPKNMGLLTFYSLKPQLNVTNPAMTVTQLQDVMKHGNSVLADTVGNPIDHTESVTWVKADISNGLLFGDIVNSRDKAKFYGYTSVDEISLYPRQGISRSTDSFGFFNGPKNAEWANEDVFPVKDQFVFDIDKRQERLHVGHKTMFQWRTDIYGNEYALYKQVQPERGPFDVGLDDIIEYERGATCEIIDGGDSLGKQKENDEEQVFIEIFEGGRVAGYDPKVEQYLIPVPFPDLRRLVNTDESGNEIFEEWNTAYYGKSPVDRRSEIVQHTPISFHGFAPDVKYDRQAYCGMFTDDICGRLHPAIERCSIVDNYTFNVYTEETDDPNTYVSSNSSTGVEDAFDNYLHPEHEGFDDNVGFSNYGFTESDVEFKEEGNVDGMLFSTEICESLVGDFDYTEEQATYFDSPLEVGETQYSDEPEKSMITPKTLYQQSTVVPGAGVFRSYNGAKIERFEQALVNILDNYKLMEDDDYTLFRDDVINDRIINIDMVYDVLILQTQTHILLEKIKFDQRTSTVLPTGENNIFIKQTGANPNIERAIMHFFNERDNTLLFGRTVEVTNEHDQTFVYPLMYIVDLNTMQYRQAHPNKHYKDQLETLFELPHDLQDWSLTKVDSPVMSYNDNTRVYNISYSSTVSRNGQDKYALFSFDYRVGTYNMKLKDSYVYHSESLPAYVSPGEEWDDRVDEKEIKLFPDDDMMPHSSLALGPPHTTRVDSISSMTGHPLSGYKFDLTIDTKTIPVSYNLDDYKINRIIFNPGDGSEPKINDRIIDDGLQVLTFDLTELPDPSDFGDPRRLGFHHEYLFDKSTPHVYTATVSAIYSNNTTATYKINIETIPYSVESGFEGAKLIDTKLFTDVSGMDRQLLVIETQNPRYVTNVMVDRNNGVVTQISGYVNGQRYTGPFHVMENGTYMTGLEHHENSRMITGIPQINDSPPVPPRLTHTEIMTTTEDYTQSDTATSSNTSSPVVTTASSNTNTTTSNTYSY